MTWRRHTYEAHGRAADEGLVAFGRNDHGQLGLGDTTSRPRPTFLEPGAWNGAAIEKIVCGAEHSLLLAGTHSKYIDWFYANRDVIFYVSLYEIILLCIK
jgi:hypothetical protein